MRFTINVRKRHLIVFLFSFVLFLGVYFVIAQTANSNPRHDSDQVWVKAISRGGSNFVAQGLEDWLGWVGDGVNDLDGRVDSLESNDIIEGPEVYAGNFQWNSISGSNVINTYLSSSIPKSYLNGISKIRFRWKNTASPSAHICPENTDIICGNGNPATSSSWSCTCVYPQSGTSGQVSTIITGSGSCSPIGSGFTNWVTFNVQGGSQSIWLNGFSSINVEFCHASNNIGTADIDVYVTPYVLRYDGYRIGMPVSI